MWWPGIADWDRAETDYLLSLCEQYRPALPGHCGPIRGKLLSTAHISASTCLHAAYRNLHRRLQMTCQ